MIDRKAMTLSDVARRCPGRGGKHTHPATVSRWVSAGIKLRDGRRVRLAATRLGVSVFVTEEALAEFIAAQNEQLAPASGAKPTTPARQRKATEAAVRALEAMGA